ncbi:hypothetical protein N658DRAFT_500705 [Parathielavia hyrcaniae]|uniref:Uncharacterized protein n=1 Tax=Parathielavia hyrcaniae TaxID=113614 RepID=A0AAN6PSK2_9PEZI|nr:hypothetical protein N658DRAFT_500705 [Parathielavia hyrcaniae]
MLNGWFLAVQRSKSALRVPWVPWSSWTLKSWNNLSTYNYINNKLSAFVGKPGFTEQVLHDMLVEILDRAGNTFL